MVLQTQEPVMAGKGFGLGPGFGFVVGSGTDILGLIILTSRGDIVVLYTGCEQDVVRQAAHMWWLICVWGASQSTVNWWTTQITKLGSLW